jgi:predicted regulator of Ras-like GTPase activity (Roadblock/LC7/MglB family)
MVSDDRSQDRWDALFGFEQMPASQRPARPTAQSRLERLLQLPGVRGTVQVALDGLVIAEAGEIDGEAHGALAAFAGSSGSQLGQTLGLGALNYAVLSFSGEPHAFLLLRQRDGYLGLLLEPEISPTHIIARLQQTRGEA